MHSHFKVFSSQRRSLLAALRQRDVSAILLFCLFFFFPNVRKGCRLSSSPDLRLAINILNTVQSLCKQAAFQHGLQGRGLCFVFVWLCMYVQIWVAGVEWATSLSVYIQSGIKSDWHKQYSKQARAIFETAEEERKEIKVMKILSSQINGTALTLCELLWEWDWGHTEFVALLEGKQYMVLLPFYFFPL